MKLNENKLNEIALKIINNNFNGWGFEDEEGFVYFVDGIFKFLKEINQILLIEHEERNN